MRLYDTHWRERFYGHPDQYPERYEANSLPPLGGHTKYCP
jgi:dipeptidyl-peptidase-4